MFFSTILTPLPVNEDVLVDGVYLRCEIVRSVLFVLFQILDPYAGIECVNLR